MALRRRRSGAVATFVLLGFLTFAGPGMANSGGSQHCYANWAGQLEVNVLTQFGTDDAALHDAIALAGREGCGVYLPAGTYTYSSSLVLDGIRLYGDGAQSVLSAVEPRWSAVTLTGAGSELRGVEVTSPNATERGDDWENAGVFINGARSFVVDHVTVDHVAGAGIFDFGGSEGQITTNVVTHAFADGIHNSHGAHDIDIAFNMVSATGDDMYSVVSYAFDGPPCRDIAIHDNVGVDESWGRGISVVGGQSIQIVRNQISHTYGAGIYIASEPAWQSLGVADVLVAGNLIRQPDLGAIHEANILIWGGRSDFPVTRVRGTGNGFDGSKAPVRVLGAADAISVT